MISKAQRMALIAFTAIGLMGLLGLSYEKCVEPSQNVWHAQARTWRKIPISVMAEADLQLESISAAINALNHRIGCTVLELSKGPTADVRVIFGESSPCGISSQVLGHPDDLARAFLCPGDTAEIQIIDGGVALYQFNLIMQHEIGHVLGLAHDDFSASVMYPSASTFYEATRPPRLTDKDARALRARYCEAREGGPEL